jgi:hypothetical protein
MKKWCSVQPKLAQASSQLPERRSGGNQAVFIDGNPVPTVMSPVFAEPRVLTPSINVSTLGGSDDRWRECSSQALHRRFLGRRPDGDCL